MAEFFGDIERFLADLYPYRWPLTVLALLLLTGVVAFAYRKGWHMVVWRHRIAVAITGTPVLALVIVIGWWLGSPIFHQQDSGGRVPICCCGRGACRNES